MVTLSASKIHPNNGVINQRVTNFTHLHLNQFLTNVPILYPLKTPGNLWFSRVFRGGYKMGTLAGDGLNNKSCFHLSLNKS